MEMFYAAGLAFAFGLLMWKIVRFCFADGETLFAIVSTFHHHHLTSSFCWQMSQLGSLPFVRECPNSVLLLLGGFCLSASLFCWSRHVSFTWGGFVYLQVFFVWSRHVSFTWGGFVYLQVFLVGVDMLVLLGGVLSICKSFL
jgi:hypothetical protein